MFRKNGIREKVYVCVCEESRVKVRSRCIQVPCNFPFRCRTREQSYQSQKKLIKRYFNLVIGLPIWVSNQTFLKRVS